MCIGLRVVPRARPCERRTIGTVNSGRTGGTRVTLRSAWTLCAIGAGRSGDTLYTLWTDWSFRPGGTRSAGTFWTCWT